MSLFYKIYGSKFNFPFPTSSLWPPLPTFLLLTTKDRLCKRQASTSNLSVLCMSFWAIPTTYICATATQTGVYGLWNSWLHICTPKLFSLRGPVWVSQDLSSYYCLPAPVFPQKAIQVDFSAVLNVLLSLYKFCAFSLMFYLYFLTLTSKCHFFPYLLPNHTENILIKRKTLIWDKPQTLESWGLDALFPLEFQKNNSFRSSFQMNLINIS